VAVHSFFGKVSIKCTL